MLVFDLLDMQELLGFVRQIQVELEEERFTLQAYLPNNNIDDIEFNFGSGNRQDEDAATVRSWDTESPIARRLAEFRRVMGELPPISRKIRLGEEERLRRRALERGNNLQIVEALYNDAAKMARAVTTRVEMFRGELLFNGRVNIAENGVEQEIDFERNPDHEVTATTPWTDPSASILSDLLDWQQLYVDNNDEAPARMVISSRIQALFLRNEELRQIAQGQDVYQPPLVNLNTVNAAFQAYGLPNFELYDTKVRVNGVQRRVTPENQILFLPNNVRELGETLSGTTAEALELAGAGQINSDQVPGLVAVVDKTFDPVATWTKAAAISLPVMYEPDLSFVATVFPES